MALDIGIKSEGKNYPDLDWSMVVSLECYEYSFLMKYLDEFKIKTVIKITDCSDAQIEERQIKFAGWTVSSTCVNMLW
jgi:hypothetical protein